MIWRTENMQVLNMMLVLLFILNCKLFLPSFADFDILNFTHFTPWLVKVIKSNTN